MAFPKSDVNIRNELVSILYDNQSLAGIRRWEIDFGGIELGFNGQWTHRAFRRGVGAVKLPYCRMTL